ncbi:hypothetical protein FAD87_RS09445 [Enterococcus hirae]
MKRLIQRSWSFICYRKMIWLSLCLLLFFCFQSSVVVEAAGWVKETLGGKNALYNFEKYPLDNYNLDFFVDTSWNWLPWKWSDGVADGFVYAVFGLTNIFWMLNVYLCYFLGFIVQEAFDLDFFSKMIHSLETTIQSIAGINKSGVMAHGLIPIFGGLVIALAGCMLVYRAVIKQQHTQAIQQAIVFLFTFICCGVFFMNAGSYLTKLNTVQQGINNEMLTIAKDLLPSDGKKGTEKDAVKAIRENLFALQIEQPWYLLEFGDSDVKTIGEKRVTSLLKESPYSEDNRRNEIVETEVTEKHNGNLSVEKVYLRFGMVFLVFIADIVISLGVIVLVVVLISSQLLLLLFTGFLPVAMIFSLFPNSSSLLGTALQKVFQLLFTKMGILLILTVAFSISYELNRLAKSEGYIWTLFLQITLWFSVSTRVNELLGWMKIGGAETRSGNRVGNLIRGMMLGKMSSGMIRGIGSSAIDGASGAITSAVMNTSVKPTNKATATLPIGEKVGSRVSAITELPANVGNKLGQMKRAVQYAPTNAQYKVREMKQDYLAGRMREENRQGHQRYLANERQQNLYEARKGVLQEEQQAKKAHVGRSMAHGALQSKVRTTDLAKPSYGSTDSVNRKNLKSLPSYSVRPIADAIKEPVNSSNKMASLNETKTSYLSKDVPKEKRTISPSLNHSHSLEKEKIPLYQKKARKEQEKNNTQGEKK